MKNIYSLDNSIRENRILKMMSFGILKEAVSDSHGIFQHFQSDVANYSTREKVLSGRGSSEKQNESIYNLSPEHDDSYKPEDTLTPSLSTRYSPDRVGVQARRIGDGVYQDPYTNKVYDYNEGFKTESGEEYSGGGVSLQSNIMRLGRHEESVIRKISISLKNSGNVVLAQKIENLYAK